MRTQRASHAFTLMKHQAGKKEVKIEVNREEAELLKLAKLKFRIRGLALLR
jgi:hypothetical protein